MITTLSKKKKLELYHLLNTSGFKYSVIETSFMLKIDKFQRDELILYFPIKHLRINHLISVKTHLIEHQIMTAKKFHQLMGVKQVDNEYHWVENSN